MLLDWTESPLVDFILHALPKKSRRNIKYADNVKTDDFRETTGPLTARVLIQVLVPDLR